jgi:hypothetical protein
MGRSIKRHVARERWNSRFHSYASKHLLSTGTHCGLGRRRHLRGFCFRIDGRQLEVPVNDKQNSRFNDN